MLAASVLSDSATNGLQMSRPPDVHVLGEWLVELSGDGNNGVFVSESAQLAVFAQCVFVSMAAILALRRKLG